MNSRKRSIEDNVDANVVFTCMDLCRHVHYLYIDSIVHLYIYIYRTPRNVSNDQNTTVWCPPVICCRIRMIRISQMYTTSQKRRSRLLSSPSLPILACTILDPGKAGTMSGLTSPSYPDASVTSGYGWVGGIRSLDPHIGCDPPSLDIDRWMA
jgi:hypothetical protein